MAGLSANEILMNGDGLVVNAFRDATGRGDYFNGSSGTSEGQFLFILGMMDAYRATGNGSALELAERALGAVLSTLYRNMPIPSQVTETSIFAPHWLFAVKYAFKSSIINYNTQVIFANGVGIIPSSTARYVYNARSLDAKYLWENPYSTLVSGTLYPVKSYAYQSGVGVRITLNTPYSGALLVTWSDQSGPVIGVNEPYEAWPDWRKLDATEIDAACDVFIRAWRAFHTAYEVTGNDTWNQAAQATLQQAKIAIDLNDGRDWMKPTWSDSPFAEGARFSYVDRTPAPGFRVDDYGRVEISIQQKLSGTGDVRYGKASINDVYGENDVTTVEVGGNRSMTIWCYIDLYETYSEANRYLAPLSLSGNGLQTFTLNRSSFKNSAGATLPVNAPVYTAGIYTNSPVAHTLWVKRIRQTPARNIAYYPGAIPFTANFAGSPPMLIDWRGPVYAGYQAPDMWVKTGNTAAAVTCTQLLVDAQAAWAAQTGFTAGPFAPVFYFNRDDAVQYGPVNTFGWEGPDPNPKWGGYQYRPLAELGVSFAGAAPGSALYTKTLQGLTTFLNWLANDKWWPSFQPSVIDAWASQINHCAASDLPPAPAMQQIPAGPPTDFPKTGAEVNYNEPHMTALILRTVILRDQKLRPKGDASGVIGDVDARVLDKCIMTLDSMWVTSGVMAGTFSNDPDAHEWYGFWHGEILTTLAMTLDWANNSGPFWKPVADRCKIWLEGMVRWAEFASPTNPSVWGDDYWPFVPDWQQGLSEQFEYSTNIITSFDGHEQRISRRPGYRRTLVMRHTLTTQQDSSRYQAILANRQSRPMLVPQWHMASKVEAAPVGQGFVMLKDDAPVWLKTGGKLLVTDHYGRQQMNTIQGVNGRRVGLATSLTFALLSGDKVLPAWMGLMNPEMSSNRVSAYYMQGETTFMMLPQEDGRSAPEYDGVQQLTFWINMVDLWTGRINTAANPITQPLPFEWPTLGILDRFPVTFPIGDDNREVIARKPNWVNDISVSDAWVSEVINYFNGPVIPYASEARGKRTLQARWSLMTSDDITDFLMLIQRLRGMQYAAWLPSWNADFILTRPVTAGNQIYVQHNAILDEGLLNLSTVGICINTRWNGLLCARVTSWSAGGVETVLTLDRDIPIDVALNDVAKVSLLWRVRQAADKAELTWVTDEVAEVQMSFITVQE